MDARIEKVLTSEQKAKVASLLHQLNAMEKTGIPPELYAALHLSSSQIEQLTDAAASGDRKAAHDKALSILTDTQKSILNQFQQAVRPPQGPQNG